MLDTAKMPALKERMWPSISKVSCIPEAQIKPHLGCYLMLACAVIVILVDTDTRHILVGLDLVISRLH